MKRVLYLFILAATACSGKITITEADIKSDIFYSEKGTRPFTGRCVVVYSDTCLIKEEFTYKQGILDGKAVAWYKSGQIRRRGSYSNGQISGKWEFWDENGHKTVEANYKNDALDGAYITLYANGKIREKGQFSDNRRTGKWLYYDEKGRRLPEQSQEASFLQD